MCIRDRDDDDDDDDVNSSDDDGSLPESVQDGSDATPLKLKVMAHTGKVKYITISQSHTVLTAMLPPH